MKLTVVSLFWETNMLKEFGKDVQDFPKSFAKNGSHSKLITDL